MTTWDKIKANLESRGPLKYQNGQWICNHPTKPGSDSMSFKITVALDGEHGAFKYHAGEDEGSLYDLAKKLGIETPEHGLHPATDTTKEYIDLNALGQDHGIPGKALEAAKWELCTHKGRRAAMYPTDTGLRYRFLDNLVNADGSKKDKYISSPGYKACWYWLDKAIAMGKGVIVLCNGEISTISAQYHGVPAFAQTGGEHAIKPELLTELSEKWQGRILYAYDKDDKGAAVSKKVKAQIPMIELVDMPLSEHGDLADYCKLYEGDSLKQLLKLSDEQNPKPEPDPVLSGANSSDAILDSIFLTLLEEKPIVERYILNPIIALHLFEGTIKYFITGKTTLIGGGTGTGKTQFLETIKDGLNMRGENVLWWGPEWSKTEMMCRALVRHAGNYISRVDNKPRAITLSELMDHFAYLGSKQDNVKQVGRKLSSLHMEALGEARMRIQAWTGKTDYFEMKDTLDETLADMQLVLESKRAQGQRIWIVFFDYAQLLNAKPSDSAINRYEQAFEDVKRFAIQNNVHIVMSTQVNKVAQADKEAGKPLRATDANYIRFDKANTGYMINQVFSQSEDEQWQETPCFWLDIVKASVGNRPFEDGKIVKRIPMEMIPHRLRFETDPDKSWLYNPKYYFVPGYAGHQSLKDKVS